MQWTIKPGYFLYKSSLHTVEQKPSHLSLGPIKLPKAEQHKNAQGKIQDIYRNDLRFSVPILGNDPGESILKINYQGCSDAGFCYPPETYFLKLTIGNDKSLQNITLETNATTHSITNTKPPTSILPEWLLMILSFYGIGLLLAFTPCVLPMVPILSGMIVGHGHNISTKKAFLLSLSYVLSMSITYSIIGAFIALLGQNLQVIMQSPWVIGGFSSIFILLALSMFKCFTISMPQSIQNKLGQITRKQVSGHYLSAIIMGCMSTLILSPCVTAPMIGALSYIAQQGQILLGMLSLFCLSIGMGTPLLLIGTSAGKLLPKAGAWMNVTQQIFGVLFISMAIYLLARILPAIVIMFMWGVLLTFAGVYCGVFKIAKSASQTFFQACGILLLFYGLLIILGASFGNTNPLQPLVKSESTSIAQITVTTLNDAEKAISMAKGKKVILDFYANWCTSCKYIQSSVLTNPRVKQALNNIVFITVDLSANDSESKLLLQHFHVVAPPTFIFLDEKGNELKELRLVGEVSSIDLLNRF